MIKINQTTESKLVLDCAITIKRHLKRNLAVKYDIALNERLEYVNLLILHLCTQDEDNVEVLSY